MEVNDSPAEHYYTDYSLIKDEEKEKKEKKSVYGAIPIFEPVLPGTLTMCIINAILQLNFGNLTDRSLNSVLAKYGLPPKLDMPSKRMHNIYLRSILVSL